MKQDYGLVFIVLCLSSESTVTEVDRFVPIAVLSLLEMFIYGAKQDESNSQLFEWCGGK